MAKNKKQALSWRIAKGAGKTAWVIAKYSGLGIWHAGKGIVKGVSLLAKKAKSEAKERAKEQEMNSSPVYKASAKSDKFAVVSSITGDYNSLESKILNDSIVALIFGKRGSGKSALGFRIMENIHAANKRNCFVLGLGDTILPEWIKSIKTIEEAPNNSVILVDEGAISFSSRESMSSGNKELGKLLAIARHKNLSILFITQNTGMIDKNVLKLSDMLLVKQGSLLQLEMERPEIKKFYEKAEAAFSTLPGEKKQYVYLIDSDFEGVVSHKLPSFWTEGISKNQAK